MSKDHQFEQARLAKNHEAQQRVDAAIKELEAAKAALAEAEKPLTWPDLTPGTFFVWDPKIPRLTKMRDSGDGFVYIHGGQRHTYGCVDLPVTITDINGNPLGGQKPC